MKSREIILIGICILLLILLLKECNISKQSQNIQVEPDYIELNGGTTLSGDSFKIINVIQLENSNLKNTIDSLKKQLKLPNSAKIINTTSVITKTDTVLVPKIDTLLVNGDSVKRLRYKDEWVDISTVLTNSPTFSIKAVDTLSFTTVKNKKETKIYIDNKSPYVSINQGYSYSVKTKKPWLTIGPHIGLDITGKPTIGVSVQYPLIRLNR
jgi:hypothetical protein